MEFRCATMDDFEKIVELYKHIIDDTKDFAILTRWVWGLHPNEEKVENYIKEHAMYILLDGENFVSVMAAPLYQTPDYDVVGWDESIDKQDAMTVHIIGVSPEYQRQGIAKFMLGKSLDIARENGKKSVRLDTLRSNVVAQHMYSSFGFNYCGSQVLDSYLGIPIEFVYYEYIV
ncbi:MAG: GNAT family N-acetyltransferase [Oscillospiraceae bacterium]|nr:GNAT family N-acetyltransferase [Candidatus Limimonas egerieequi]